MQATDATPPAVADSIVRVDAPARLHLGFIDVSGNAGRRFGSIGLTLDGWDTVLWARQRNSERGAHEVSSTASFASSSVSSSASSFASSFASSSIPRLPPPMPFAVEGAHSRVEANSREVAERVLKYVEAIAERLKHPLALHLHCHQPTPAHSGFGTGTQLALAVSAAIARLSGLLTPARDLAVKLDRGKRSGIGLGVFEQGGFIVDGGRAPSSPPEKAPPMVARLPFPEAWRIVLLFDRSVRGLSGEHEVRAFGELPDFPVAAAHQLAHGVLMGALPALAEHDVKAFGRAIGELQRVVGDHFAPVQGGRFNSPAVTEALAWIEAQGVPGVGQSSWGPTGFAIVGSEDEARSLVSGLRSHLGLAHAIELQVAKGRNRGASVDLIDAWGTPPR